MKIRVVVLVSILLLWGCKESGKPASIIKNLIGSQDIDKTKNILIFTINPNDCMNCLIGFNSINQDLNKAANSRLYLISVERAIEKIELSKAMTGIDLSPSKNKSVFWNKKLVQSVNESAGLGAGMSSIIIYNYQKDSIVFSKPAREINDASALKNLLLP